MFRQTLKKELHKKTKSPYIMIFEDNSTVKDFIYYIKKISYDLFEGGTITFFLNSSKIFSVVYDMGQFETPIPDILRDKKIGNITISKKSRLIEYNVELLPELEEFSAADAISILKDFLGRCSEFYDESTEEEFFKTEEIVRTKMAFLKAIDVLEKQNNKRISQYVNGQVRNNYCKESNPCGCGSKCFHYEYNVNNKEVYGVCNNCGEDIYTVKDEFKEDTLKIGEWK